MKNKKPLVSFTFDDFPKSAATRGASILEKYGYAGTFYGCGGLLGHMHDDTLIVTEEDIKALHRGGHEIGCHTYGHIDCQRSPNELLSADLQKNKHFIEDLTGSEISSFAYPFGKIDMSSRRTVSNYYKNARTVFPGLNAGKLCMHSLKSYSLYSNGFDLAAFEKIIKTAIDQNAWLIFYTHDVSETPAQFGCRPEEFEAIVRLINDSGLQTVTTMNKAPEYIF
ncbi:polysaccharide deacetylase family protein [Kordiimonas sp. SCSIO 12610]|uniref:polysaccharide deacetylase family protein n=1 Tax=Kordiimonas sp. SCSIO 12610 TaxID=2829597 RepID=UPI00210B8ED4|nr:polysaccharide deacetylase family protein [Kordiimonas sp. SCSIO 12610]UTW55879.1 polysaccharide deacetylase family protein [Kordiimonas sp. SCSIO 12610]